MLCILVCDLLIYQGAYLQREKIVNNKEWTNWEDKLTHHIIIQGYIVGQYNVELDNLVELVNLGVNSLPLAVCPAQVVIVVLRQLETDKKKNCCNDNPQNYCRTDLP